MSNSHFDDQEFRVIFLAKCIINVFRINRKSDEYVGLFPRNTGINNNEVIHQWVISELEHTTEDDLTMLRERFISNFSSMLNDYQECYH